MVDEDRDLQFTNPGGGQKIDRELPIESYPLDGVYTGIGSADYILNHAIIDNGDRSMKANLDTIGYTLYRDQVGPRMFQPSIEGSNYIGLTAPTLLTSNITFILPPTIGNQYDILMVDGSGAMYWSNEVSESRGSRDTLNDRISQGLTEHGNLKGEFQVDIQENGVEKVANPTAINYLNGFTITEDPTGVAKLDFTGGYWIRNSGSGYVYLNTLTDKVGIGTDTPSTVLHIYKQDTSTNTILNVLTLEHTSSNTPVAGFGVGLLFKLKDQAGASRDAAKITSLWEDDDSNYDGVLTFGTRDGVGSLSEKMRITSDGKVGIGTIVPLTKLHINGGAVHTRLMIGASADYHAGILLADDLSYKWYIGSDGHTAGNLFTIGKVTGTETWDSYLSINHTSGNIGIGTDSPSDKLEIKSAGTNTKPLKIQASDGSALFDFGEHTSGYADLQMHAADGSTKIRFHTENDSYINNGYGLSIGTTLITPGVLLDVRGGAVFNQDGNDVDFRVESDGNANMLVVDGGNNGVGIGLNSPLTSLHIKDQAPDSQGLAISITSLPAIPMAFMGCGNQSENVWITGGAEITDNVNAANGFTSRSQDSPGNGHAAGIRVGNANGDIKFYSATGLTNGNTFTWSASTDVGMTMVIKVNGNVGIGVNAPAVPEAPLWNSNAKVLHIYQNTTNGALVRVQSSNASGYFHAGSNFVALVSGSGGDHDELHFWTGGRKAANLKYDEFVINELGVDMNFRVRSLGNTNMLFVDAGVNRVGIGTSGPTESLDVNGNIALTGNLIPNISTTSELGNVTNTFAKLWLNPTGSVYWDTSTYIQKSGTSIIIRQGGFDRLTIGNPTVIRGDFIPFGTQSLGSSGARWDYIWVNSGIIPADGATELGISSQRFAKLWMSGDIDTEGLVDGVDVSTLPGLINTKKKNWVTKPTGAGVSGTAGDMAYESGYLYICVATDTWQRVAIATWA